MFRGPTLPPPTWHRIANQLGADIVIAPDLANDLNHRIGEIRTGNLFGGRIFSDNRSGADCAIQHAADRNNPELAETARMPDNAVVEEDGTPKCPVCPEAAIPGEQWTYTNCLPRTHVFHRSCLQPLWDRAPRGDTTIPCPMCKHNVDESTNFTYQDPEEGVCHIMTAGASAGTIAYLTDRAKTSKTRIRITTIAFSALQRDQQASHLSDTSTRLRQGLWKQNATRFWRTLLHRGANPPPLGKDREHGQNHRGYMQA